MLNDLVGAEMIAALLVRSIGMVQYQQIEPHCELMKGQPRLVKQGGCVETVEEGASLCLNGEESCSGTRRMVGRKREHAIRTDHEGLQRLYRMDAQVEFLFGLEVKQSKSGTPWTTTSPEPVECTPRDGNPRKYPPR